MYLAIIVLPLLGSIVSGFFGRKVGVSGAQLITCSSVIVTTLLAIVAFFEVGLNNIPVSIQLFRWIDSESLNVLWGFHFDSLTVSMLIPVLIVSSLVHVYSIGYMSHDPHNQRFFSYLSLFTFMMIILVTANNFLLMFVGWEGNHKCLKWLDKIENRHIYSHKKNFRFNNVKNYIFNQTTRRFFHTETETETEAGTKLRSELRIGPHNFDVLSVLIGSLFGDTQLEKRKNSAGTRIIFKQSNHNIEYLMWFHKFFAFREYCNQDKPKLLRKIIKNNKVLYRYRVSSYTFTSLNWLHEMFYKDNKKSIPCNLSDYLTPLALAVWFMHDGSKLSKGAKIAINCFTRNELQYLCEILKKKYNLDTVLQTGGKNKKDKEIIYIKSTSMTIFYKIIKPHMLPFLYYKLGDS